MSFTFNWINPLGSIPGGGFTSITTSKGANNIAAGDLLIAIVNIQASVNSDPGAITPPAGWTQAAQAAQGSTLPAFDRQGVFYKIAGASETGAYTFSWTSTTNPNWTLMDYTVSGGTPSLDVAGNNSATNTTSIIAPSVSPVGTTDLLVCTGFTSGNVWSGNFAGMTSRQLDSNISGFGLMSVAIADLILSAAGATGTETATATNAAIAMATSSTFSISGGAARTPTLTLMGVG